MKRCGRVMHGNGEVLAEQVFVANSFWTRFLGLMGKARLQPSEGLMLIGVGSIHTCFMRFSIDVVYLDEEFRVLHVETVRPWRIGSFIKRTKHVLELSEGKASALVNGEQLSLVLDTVGSTSEGVI